MNRQLTQQGFFLTQVDLPKSVHKLVLARDWPGLDRVIREVTLPGGVIFERLREYAEFSEIEFIISIRSSHEFPDDDGIWHDDGSRILAFSLSLMLNEQAIEGGRLEIRRRGETEGVSLVTPPFGTMIVFATGTRGFEHKINRVSRGERLIIAGWCT